MGCVIREGQFGIKCVLQVLIMGKQQGHAVWLAFHGLKPSSRLSSTPVLQHKSFFFCWYTHVLCIITCVVMIFAVIYCCQTEYLPLAFYFIKDFIAKQIGANFCLSCHFRWSDSTGVVFSLFLLSAVCTNIPDDWAAYIFTPQEVLGPAELVEFMTLDFCQKSRIMCFPTDYTAGCFGCPFAHCLWCGHDPNDADRERERRLLRQSLSLQPSRQIQIYAIVHFCKTGKHLMSQMLLLLERRR